MIRAVLFDLDGTLVNTLPDLTYITNATLQDLGFPKRTKDEICMFIGNGVKKLIARALPEGITLTQSILDLMQANYLKYQNRLSTVYDGIPTLLEKLHECGIRTAISTNKPHKAAEEVTRKYFGDLIDYTQGQVEGIPVKPAPDSCERILGKLQVKKTEAIYVGDSDTDIETAKNLGVLPVSCTWGYRDEEFLRAHGAQIFVRKPEEILELVRKL